MVAVSVAAIRVQDFQIAVGGDMFLQVLLDVARQTGRAFAARHGGGPAPDSRRSGPPAAAGGPSRRPPAPTRGVRIGETLGQRRERRARLALSSAASGRAANGAAVFVMCMSDSCPYNHTQHQPHRYRYASCLALQCFSPLPGVVSCLLAYHLGARTMPPRGRVRVRTRITRDACGGPSICGRRRCSPTRHARAAASRVAMADTTEVCGRPSRTRVMVACSRERVRRCGTCARAVSVVPAWPWRVRGEGQDKKRARRECGESESGVRPAASAAGHRALASRARRNHASNRRRPRGPGHQRLDVLDGPREQGRCHGCGERRGRERGQRFPGDAGDLRGGHRRPSGRGSVPASARAEPEIVSAVTNPGAPRAGARSSGACVATTKTGKRSRAMNVPRRRAWPCVARVGVGAIAGASECAVGAGRRWRRPPCPIVDMSSATVVNGRGPTCGRRRAAPRPGPQAGPRDTSRGGLAG